MDAIEFRPERSGRCVHHALIFVDRGSVARTKKETEPGGGYPCFGAPGFLPVGGLGGWTPGSPPIHTAVGASEILTKRSDLVIQLHFHPTGKPESVQSPESRFPALFTEQARRRAG